MTMSKEPTRQSALFVDMSMEPMVQIYILGDAQNVKVEQKELDTGRILKISKPFLMPNR